MLKNDERSKRDEEIANPILTVSISFKTHDYSPLLANIFVFYLLLNTFIKWFYFKLKLKILKVPKGKCADDLLLF